MDGGLFRAVVRASALLAVLACAAPAAAQDPTDPKEPVLDRGSQFEPKPAGTVETLRFWYGPYVVPPGNDMNRFDLNLPVREGFVLSIEPRLRLASDFATPQHQHAHIHHAHWLRLDPGNQEDTNTYGFTQWLWGTGDEETRADARRQSSAEPNGPVYGGHTAPGKVEPVIYMIHNKTSQLMTTYITLDVVFAHGSPEALKQATGREHRSPVGVIFGKTYDVPRKPDGRGYYESAWDDPEPMEWVATRDGTIVGAGGHLHPGGQVVTIENLGSKENPCPRTKYSKHGGTTLFRSEAVHRTAPLSEDFQMTVPRAAWRAPVRKGDRLRISGRYENRDHAWYAVMTHAGVYIDDKQPPRAGCKPYLVGRHAAKTKRKRKKPDLTKGVLNRDWRGPPEPTCGRHTGVSEHHGGVHDGGPCERDEPDRGPGVETAFVTIADFVYSPGDRGLGGALGAPARVRHGSSLTFVNLDQEAGIRHTVTTCPWPCNGPYVANYPLADGRWDSGMMGYDFVDGGSPNPTARTPSDLPVGRYAYFCRTHPWMRGAFEVTP